MRRDKNILLAAIAALIMLPSMLLAQNSASINTFSPYTMYGVGELNTQGTLSTRSMGGAGVSMRSPGEINLLNPASYSIALNRSVLFSYGLEGSNYFNSQTIGSEKLKNSYATGNFHDIALQVPIAKNMGIGFSLTPYSSTGYNIETFDTTSDAAVNIGMLSYNYTGNGDITQVKLGFGWEVVKSLSLGVAAQYYWGGIYRSFTMTPQVVTGNGSFLSTTGKTTFDISKIKAQVGAQWSPIRNAKRNLTFGATYDFGGDLTPDYTHNIIGYGTLVSVVATSINETLPLVLPNQLTVGSTYQTPKWIVGLDYTYQNWYSNNKNSVEYSSSGIKVAYNDFGTCKLGVQWTPNRTDVRHYFRRVSYRAGMRYGGYEQSYGDQDITQYAATLGASFPIKFSAFSRIDVGLEYGSRGSDKVIGSGDSSISLIKQNYFKFALGFTLFGEDGWFQRIKFD